MNECKDCNYKTEDKSNYKKHLESKKHLNNINKCMLYILFMSVSE